MNLTPENTARNVLRHLYPDSFQLRRIASDTKDVFLAEFAGGGEQVLIKMPRGQNPEFVREQRILDQLESAGIAVPPILYTQENRPFGELIYTIQHYVKGPTIAQVMKWDDDRTEVIFANIGQLAAQLSAVSFAAVPDALLAETTQEHELQWWEDYLDFVSRHRGTSPVIWQIFHAARGIMLSPPTVFGHRDGVQVVTDGESIYLVDVGSAGANWLDGDFARMLYGGIVWHGGDEYDTWWKAAQNAYFIGRRPSDADVERIIILMVYYALRDAGMAASAGRTSRVDQLYDYANFFINDVRKWFGR